MKLTLKAIKLAGATPELDMFWVSNPDDPFGGEFEPPRLREMSRFTPGAELEIARAFAESVYPPECIEIIDASIDL